MSHSLSSRRGSAVRREHSMPSWAVVASAGGARVSEDDRTVYAALSNSGPGPTPSFRRTEQRVHSNAVNPVHRRNRGIGGIPHVVPAVQRKRERGSTRSKGARWQDVVTLLKRRRARASSRMGDERMKLARAIALIAGVALGTSLFVSPVFAQTESASAEDGKPASEAPAETAPVPNVPLGANLTPPLGALPPGPAIIFGPGSGQPGSSSVSMAPGTLTAGVAREGANAVRAPGAEPAPAAVVETAPEPVADTTGTADTDGDGVIDSDEVDLYGTDPNTWDTDGDGLGDGDELFVAGTDPLRWDTNGDGISDGGVEAVADAELVTETETLATEDSVPVVAEDSVSSAEVVDSDADRLADADEAAVGTDPNNPDSDGDGYYDGDEMNLGTDPLDPASV